MEKGTLDIGSMRMDTNFQSPHIRLLPLEGLYNVRDLGGYPAGDRQVRWGMLYRAGDIHDLSDQARDYLEKRGVKAIVDFRDPGERADAPDGNLATVEKTYALPIDAGNVLELRHIGSESASEGLMRLLYTALIDRARPQYRRFFSILIEAGNQPLLFHCSAGKDRTGVGAALILSALGVSRDIIFQDYLLSAEYLRGKYRGWLAETPYLEPLMTVQAGYLGEAFDCIDHHFGGVDRYLRDELGADIDRLRALYTEPAAPGLDRNVIFS